MLNREQLIKIGIDEKWLEPLNDVFTKYFIIDTVGDRHPFRISKPFCFTVYRLTI